MDKEYNEIEELFKRRDEKKYEEALKNARYDALNSSREERNTRKRNRERNAILVRIIAIALTGLLIVGGGKIASNMTSKDYQTEITDIQDEYSMTELGKEIGSLVYVKGDYFNEKFDTTLVSILNQCTHRTSDNSGFYYSHTDIASKILSLDPELREYALCSVLNDMKSYRTQEFEPGKNNADYLMSIISTMEKNNDTKLLDGATSLEEYLKMKGYVKEDGTTSFEMFKNREDENAPIIKEIIDSLVESKGVSK